MKHAFLHRVLMTAILLTVWPGFAVAQNPADVGAEQTPDEQPNEDKKKAGV